MWHKAKDKGLESGHVEVEGCRAVLAGCLLQSRYERLLKSSLCLEVAVTIQNWPGPRFSEGKEIDGLYVGRDEFAVILDGRIHSTALIAISLLNGEGPRLGLLIDWS